MQTLQISIYVVAALVVLALLFDFMNGFHDAANAIATVVSTGVLKASAGGGDGRVLQCSGGDRVSVDGGGYDWQRNDTALGN
jgi:hypothetical protein